MKSFFGGRSSKPPKSPLSDIEEDAAFTSTLVPAFAPTFAPAVTPGGPNDNEARRAKFGVGASDRSFTSSNHSPVKSPSPTSSHKNMNTFSPMSVKFPTPKGTPKGVIQPTAAAPLPAGPLAEPPKPNLVSSLPPPSLQTTASASKKHSLPDDFRLRIPAAALRELPESGAPIGVVLAPVARNAGVACTSFCTLLSHVLVAVRFALALPVGALLLLGLSAVVLLVLLQLVWLLPLALLLGLLLPSESNARTSPMELPTQHVVILGGGGGLTRAVALECVRRGADVTVLAAGASRASPQSITPPSFAPATSSYARLPTSLPLPHVTCIDALPARLTLASRAFTIRALSPDSEALTQTYELMKQTSLERHAAVKQQLRCSPLELTDGPMACFVALQNVLELVGKIDCFICHPSELLLERGKSGTPSPLPSPGSAADTPRVPISTHEITQAVLCAVWSVRAIMFPMQRQANGRVLVLGSAPSHAVPSERVQYKLAMQSLGRSLRAELGDFRIPVSLSAPIGSLEPVPSADPDDVPPPRPASGITGLLTGMGRSPPSLHAYSVHAIDGMLAGAPYILAPGGDGVIVGGSPTSGGGGGVLGGLFGYGTLTPAIMVLQALTMPLLSLLDSGMPVLWREVGARCWWGHAIAEARKEPRPDAYARLGGADNPLAA